MTAWVVVANGGNARLFASSSIEEFEEIETLVNPYNRLHERDLITDRQGLSRNSAALQTESYEQPSAKKHEQERFAAELAGHLEKAYHENRFNTLYLICSPSFLGLVRQELSPKVCETIKAEIHKNLVTHSVSDIRAQLPKRLLPMV
ncbi:host attachment protein [Saccharospirillum salsuginis]|uniref:Host attachment protein n=1 Tax=Saccharospirillum salsuginis TaxID=418750 RepID=A0A918K944_9GAMM|nr:host attachment protein [Saccharospirillum salsuginis]GGX53143.1 hypothetical protein GCM10007392_20800 [Saccharospirillum salsuginis]